jgi:hypothetical protein
VQRKSRNQQDEVVPEVVSVVALAVAGVPPEDEERREAEVVSVVVVSVVVSVVVVVPREEDLAVSPVEEVHHVVLHEVAVVSSHGHLDLASSRVFSAWFGVRKIPMKKVAMGRMESRCVCLLSADRACWLYGQNLK